MAQLIMRTHLFISFWTMVMYTIALPKSLTDLETTKNTILTTLQEQQEPRCVEEFNTFAQTYESLVTAFFDKEDKRSLGHHIEAMEEGLRTLRKVCADPVYHKVKHLLEDYQHHLTELVTLLKQYKGSTNTTTLALQVKKFKKLLPAQIRKRGDVSLYWSLHHRLRCA